MGAGGTAGAATGTAVGGTMGAVVGLPAAIFTFGLSIPVCAVVGAGAGFCTDTAVGSTVGAGCGAAGYKAYHNRDDIKSSAKSSLSKINNSLTSLSNRAKQEVSKVVPAATGGSSAP